MPSNWNEKTIDFCLTISEKNVFYKIRLKFFYFPDFLSDTFRNELNFKRELFTLTCNKSL